MLLLLLLRFSVFLEMFDFNGMAIITGVMGFFRTWIHVPMPLVFAEYLTQERYPLIVSLTHSCR